MTCSRHARDGAGRAGWESGGSNRGRMPSQVTVLLADDEDVVRHAIGELLETDPRFRVVVASVGSADAATRAAGEWQPKLAVVDVRMPGGGHAAIVGHPPAFARDRGDGLLQLRRPAHAYRDAGCGRGRVRRERCRRPARRRLRSAGHLRVAVASDHGRRHTSVVPRPCSRFDDDRPADGRGPLAHAPQPEMPRTVGDRSRVEADTVVDDPHHELVVVPTHGQAHDAGVPRAGGRCGSPPARRGRRSRSSPAVALRRARS